MPIENRMLSNAIESAQSRVEERNFGIRRSVLQYDDVMNRQREIIYSQRDQVLAGDDLGEKVRGMVHDSIDGNVALYTSGESPFEWNLNGLREYYLGWLTNEDDFRFTEQETEDLEKEALIALLTERADAIYKAKEEQYGDSMMRELERVVLLRTVDRYWMDHIDNMDELRRGIHLRAYGQHDPVVMYRLEGFEMFDAMVNSIREDTARGILLAQIRTHEEPKREQVAKETGTSGDGTAANRTVRKTADQKIGRNDPCPCGSGKKYKKCCGAGTAE